MIVTCAHDNDDTEEQTEEAQHDPEENKDPCSIGTPVCLPAVVWFEDKQGKVSFLSIFTNINVSVIETFSGKK